MALPASRNRTYAPGVDIASADLNALQDCVVAGKHGVLSYPIDPGAFSPSIVSTTLTRPIGGPWNFAGASGLPHDLAYRFVMPVGRRLASVAWLYNRGGAGTITMRVLKANMPAGIVGTTLSTTTINSGTGLLLTTVTPAYALETDYSLTLWVNVTATANMFYGAIVVLDKP